MVASFRNKLDGVALFLKQRDRPDSSTNFMPFISPAFLWTDVLF